MPAKKIRSRTSQNSIPVASLANNYNHRPNNHSNQTSANNNNAAAKLAKNDDELVLMTKEQLKIECRKRGQKTTGNKTELLQRLGYKMTATTTKRKDAATSNGAPQIDDPTFSLASGDQKQRKERERKERENLVLWKAPLQTMEYATKELLLDISTYSRKLLANKQLLITLLLATVSIYVLLNTRGPHEQLVELMSRKLFWCLYWIGLGILSSVGLGTGLHTFLLYLGPHIAAVTLAAYECGTLDFPQPPYPDEIVCPEGKSAGAAVSILGIMSKVRLEAMCWGAGTALGELPPYFMARAARLSGIDPDEDEAEEDGNEIKEFEVLRKKQKLNELTWMERGKLFVEELVQKVGFLGILACASIPNPLFDLAGITCGHFLVPFWTFFGATLIGKAIIKMHIQKLFVIIAFNETLIATALDWLKIVPVIGDKLQVPFKLFLNGQKAKLHKNSSNVDSGSEPAVQSGNLLGAIFEKFVFAMIFYFILSIVNSFAQSYHKRIHKRNKHSKQSKEN